MTKPILTEEQLEAKIDEFNNIPKDKRCAGMKSSVNCERARDLIRQTSHKQSTRKENGYDTART